MKTVRILGFVTPLNTPPFITLMRVGVFEGTEANTPPRPESYKGEGYWVQLARCEGENPYKSLGTSIPKWLSRALSLADRLRLGVE